ncbi:hypothetical protein ACFC26_09630 [Kitasatospora purpeofusca]|uniref:hypothetical protein n=1 Tax=Kitasatospora purpeofusca TaxID=67352 RepID=UPI0035D71940
MASQVTQGVVVAGLVLAAGGAAMGMYSAGEDCGSPWSPKESSYVSRDVPASCSAKISERQGTSWLLLVGGVAALAGGLVAKPKEGTPEQAAGPRAVGEGPLVP